MNAICLVVAGVLRATLPTNEVTIAWLHSVEKIRWVERYRVEHDALRLIEARIEGSGAGMDPPSDATFAGGGWTWHPAVDPLPHVRLTVSPFARDYDVCDGDRCRTLTSIIASGSPSSNARGRIEVVDMQACRRANG